ncbi:MAG: endonuclease/exonuclease/phosphatase family protein [Acidimicrobiia bacterium]|nr:endonuclease/exonuclease/phosphatase family protein [Acidimicrobiia bacterium]
MPIRRADSAVTSFARTFGGLALLTIGFLATVGTILGFFGSAWWMFDVMAGYRVQFAIALILSGILYGLILGRATSVVFLIAAAINIVVILPLYLDGPADPKPGGSIDVASINVRTTGAGREMVFRWIEATDADVVVLLETSEAWVDQVEARGLGYRIMAQIPDDRVYGVTVLARSTLPVEILRAGDVDEVVIRTETTVDDTPVVIYAFQPRTPTSADTAAARDEVVDFVARRAQDETSPVMVVGALNATPWSHAFRNLTGTANLIDSTRGFGFQPSWPANQWRILHVPSNHLLHSPELTTVERLIGPDVGSEHRPLLVRIALADA